MGLHDRMNGSSVDSWVDAARHGKAAAIVILVTISADNKILCDMVLQPVGMANEYPAKGMGIAAPKYFIQAGLSLRGACPMVVIRPQKLYAKSTQGMNGKPSIPDPAT